MTSSLGFLFNKIPIVVTDPKKSKEHAITIILDFTSGLNLFFFSYLSFIFLTSIKVCS